MPVYITPEMDARIAETDLAELSLDTRITNKLHDNGMATILDVLNRSREKLLAIPNVGEKTVKEIQRALCAYLGVPNDEPKEPVDQAA